MRSWLMKSEPSVYSIDDLARDGQTEWEGVRNYQVRNFMRDEMQKGERVLFYHSNADPAGAAGVARIVREAYPDDAALDPRSRYHDPRATQDDPIWLRVDIAFETKLPRLVTLDEMKANPALANMPVLRRGNRLSVTPCDEVHFHEIVAMAGRSSRRR